MSSNNYARLNIVVPADTSIASFLWGEREIAKCLAFKMHPKSFLGAEFSEREVDIFIDGTCSSLHPGPCSHENAQQKRQIAGDTVFAHRRDGNVILC